MPHKHTRRGAADTSTLDLPPTVIAKPLSVSKSAAENNSIFTSTSKRPNNKKRKRNADAQDDTPKAFARLMAFQQGKKLRSGLDDGTKGPKKKKQKQKQNSKTDTGSEPSAAAEHSQQQEEETQTSQIPTIRPGERMAEFSARVDAALPIGGLINKTGKGGKDPLGLQAKRTFKEKKMHRMYAEWREEERRIQERREAEREEHEMEALEEGEDGQVVWAEGGAKSGGKKGKRGRKGRRKVVGEVDDGEEDPWARIERERGGKAAFGDVVQAPPTFAKAPKAKFKVRGAAVDVGDVPKASGSLRKREELGSVRKSVVEGYRQMMKENRSRMDA